MSVEKKSTDEVFDIVIVGGGLVGSSVAALLAQSPSTQALRIAVVDGGDAPTSLENIVGFDTTENPQFDPRVVALTHASQTLFAQLGIWDNIKQRRACAYTDMHVWDNDGTANIHFSAEDIQQTHLGYIVENALLQGAVYECLMDEENEVTMFHGLQIETITQEAEQCHQKTGDSSNIILSCKTGEQISAKLVVAADGGQSTIRQLADIPTREWSYEHKAIVATVRSSKSHQLTAWQNFLSTGPLAFLPLDHPSENYCSIVWSLDSELADEMMQLNEDDFCCALSRAFQHRLGDVEYVSQRYCFPLHQRHAVDYVKDNIVLVGDAAHTIHPLAGQGVNLGLLDAQALVAELIRGVERGLTVNEPSLLRRYQRQRKANNLEVMLLMEGLKRLFSHRNIAVRWLRNVGLKKVNQLAPLKNWLTKRAIRD
ncbi:UbiH/UbiF/VisC/COQ6 family ubiquinone biosynthesis hydroxylase [Eionea flava]